MTRTGTMRMTRTRMTMMTTRTKTKTTRTTGRVLTLPGIDSWYHEKESAWLYRQVAATEPDPRKRELFLKLAMRRGTSHEVAAACQGATAAAPLVHPLAARPHRGAPAAALRAALPAPVLAAMKLRGLSRSTARPRPPAMPCPPRSSRSAPATAVPLSGSLRAGGIRHQRRTDLQRQPGAGGRGRRGHQQHGAYHRGCGPARRRTVHGSRGVCLGALAAGDVRVPDRRSKAPSLPSTRKRKPRSWR